MFVGDSESDVMAGRAAGIPTIGYANRPGKRQRLAEAGAVWSAPKIPDRGSNMISVWNGDVHGAAETDLFAGVPR